MDERLRQALNDLRVAFDKEPSREARAVLAIHEAEALQAIQETARARERTLVALHEDPKIVTGVLAPPWRALEFQSTTAAAYRRMRHGNRGTRSATMPSRSSREEPGRASALPAAARTSPRATGGRCSSVTV